MEETKQSLQKIFEDARDKIIAGITDYVQNHGSIVNLNKEPYLLLYYDGDDSEIREITPLSLFKEDETVLYEYEFNGEVYADDIIMMTTTEMYAIISSM